MDGINIYESFALRQHNLNRHSLEQLSASSVKKSNKVFVNNKVAYIGVSSLRPTLQVFLLLMQD